MFACFASHLECVELLLSRQADVGIRDKVGSIIIYTIIIIIIYSCGG